MAKSNKPIFWSLFAAGGTLAAFLAPVLALLFLMLSLGHAPDLLSYAKFQAFDAHWFGKLFLMGVITLFLWHAAHRLRVTMFDFGLRKDSVVAIVVYLVAGIGTIVTAASLLRI